jgi:DNA-binding NtrC family response regulator
MDRYDAPSNDEVAGRYPYLVYKHDGSFAPVVESCERYAPYDDTVLLLGETGTGKELLARVIYDASERPGEFLAMNCGASRRDLIVDDLFGHVKGAYTGADKSTEGFLGDVGSGTLFLDEIGALPLECQPALLRVLDKGEYNRIGETEKRQFKGRIIAATQPSFDDKVRCGQFMEDLAYRLGRFVVKVPALRESREDIPLLMDHFFTEGAQKYNKTRPVLSAKARERFLSYFWPGNVRQMQSVISDALVSYSGGELDERNLEELLKRHTWISPSTASHDHPIPRPQETMSFEQRFREACNNSENRSKSTKRIINTKVAECVGMDRHDVEAWLKKLNIS